MTPTLITLDVIGTIAVVVLCVIDGAWYWWAGLALMVIMDIGNMIIMNKVKQKKAAAERAQAAQVIPAAVPAAASVPVQQAKPKDPDGFPSRIGEAIRVQLATGAFDPVRPAVIYARAGEPVELVPEDGRIAVYQGDLIGRLRADAAPMADLVTEWTASGEPFRAVLATLPFASGSGRVKAAFYRDEMAAIRQRDGAFESRIGAPDAQLLTEDRVGCRMAVYQHPGTHRYVLTLDGLDAGILSDTAITALRKTEREPADAIYYLASVSWDEAAGVPVCSVLVA